MTSPFYISTATMEMGKINFVLERKYLNYTNMINHGNWSFLDMQNLYKSTQDKDGFPIDWEKFRLILLHKYNVTRALVFMGYLKTNIPLYYRLQKAGFEIHFRTVKIKKDGTIDGGNVDVDLCSYAMDHKNEYNKAIVISNDADYCQMLKSLQVQNKLQLIISSHTIEGTSKLLKKSFPKEQIISIHELRNHIEWNRKNE